MKHSKVDDRKVNDVVAVHHVAVDFGCHFAVSLVRGAEAASRRLLMKTEIGTGENLEAKFEDTPWGRVQSVESIAPGIDFYATASHGGYYLSAEMNSRIPVEFKKSTMNEQGLHGWYEEDCDWAIVVFCLKEYFGQAYYESAVKAVKRFHSDAWTAVNNS
jgi:hypothetical protein